MVGFRILNSVIAALQVLPQSTLLSHILRHWDTPTIAVSRVYTSFNFHLYILPLAMENIMYAFSAFIRYIIPFTLPSPVISCITYNNTPTIRQQFHTFSSTPREVTPTEIAPVSIPSYDPHLGWVETHLCRRPHMPIPN